jgi:hypothetical protein
MGWAATARATASNRKVRNPAHIRRMLPCILLSMKECNCGQATLGKFRIQTPTVQKILTYWRQSSAQLPR